MRQILEAKGVAGKFFNSVRLEIPIQISKRSSSHHDETLQASFARPPRHPSKPEFRLAGDPAAEGGWAYANPLYFQYGTLDREM